MTKTDGGAMAARAMELKKELWRLVKEIVDEDDYMVETADQAITTLCSLKYLKQSNNTLSFKLDDHAFTVPQEFRCPISKELMKDPVVLATGQTYDRAFIQRWFNEGNRTCPQTQQVLSHLDLTPNQLVKEMISQWCKENGVELPKPVDNIDEAVTAAERVYLQPGYIHSLLDKLSQSLSDQKEAAKELRKLTKKMPSFRALFGTHPDAIPQLLNPLSSGSADTHPDLQEDLITTVLNLSIHDNNKRLVAEDPVAIPLLIESLKSGTIQTRSNAAAALFTLSALDPNKLIIGKSGALKPLIDLLDEGHPSAMKDAATAIFNICFAHENKGRAVNEGAVNVILKKIADHVLVDELLAILAMLSSHQNAVDEMGELGAVSCLLNVIRESTCEHNKENCVAILFTICMNDRTKWKEIRQEENANGTLSRLAQSGTLRAKRKASGILERLNKAAPLTHTA
ncbi:hypothetical protein SO802_017620 [Lithocarpus litseifolius]|uniref:RING-type E3 ubiquitin transferase n=1 Tax=Lithocarpus litseifolius TaxID=425828 RepID=A0AAW2CKF7_9ROSI